MNSNQRLNNTSLSVSLVSAADSAVATGALSRPFFVLAALIVGILSIIISMR
jgi:hypothetical protein